MAYTGCKQSPALCVLVSPGLWEALSHLELFLSWFNSIVTHGKLGARPVACPAVWMHLVPASRVAALAVFPGVLRGRDWALPSVCSCGQPHVLGSGCAGAGSFGDSRVVPSLTRRAPPHTDLSSRTFTSCRLPVPEGHPSRCPGRGPGAWGAGWPGCCSPRAASAGLGGPAAPPPAPAPSQAPSSGHHAAEADGSSGQCPPGALWSSVLHLQDPESAWSQHRGRGWRGLGCRPDTGGEPPRWGCTAPWRQVWVSAVPGSPRPHALAVWVSPWSPLRSLRSGQGRDHHPRAVERATEAWHNPGGSDTGLEPRALDFIATTEKSGEPRNP
ncbi:PREDICTED: uncharacterized protein LOC102008662 [Chinchilla lanigera]|uniref:uncharacterized protein LOC102008662 n=1 Tax=Chinchilla lanigera TaxID=34839 RepID=UPI0006962448|nr:PREDICTED: uncharacterized protein LOC102008662 [Chinchilla lanigera]XP_013363270.1 PREDICTED: uncharacterized protein LOC102008662 [Chinchilla lanigera]XP_013363271.1 PREDICTED: uncharacterized protein LOC102008662 [Chinchilla lanigera]